MSCLAKSEIISYMSRANLSERLVVTPLIVPDESFDASSVNVRLGNEFIIMKKQTFPILDIADREELSSNIEKYQGKIRIDYHEQFVLHPNQLIIGCTLEYVSIPKKLMCYVIGKSSWGRMGLIIATATKVDPGYRGVITLEIINEGEIPIVLYPGVPIAQLVFHEVIGKSEYDGMYSYSTGPKFPDFNKNYEKWKFWYKRK